MQDLLSMDRQLQPSIYPSKSRGKQILLKTTHLSDYFMYQFPCVFKKEITMRFPWLLSNAKFSRGLCIFVKKSSACILRYAIQFLVTFSKYSTRFTVLLEISSFCRILVDTDSNNRKFCNDTIFWKFCPKKWKFPGTGTL